MTSLGRKKTESNCLANFPRTISQTSSLFRQSQHKRKIRDKNKRYCRQNKCSDLTSTKKYALTEGPKRGWGGELMWASRSAPPSLRASCPIWASETSRARTRERSREARFARPNRTACSQAKPLQSFYACYGPATSPPPRLPANSAPQPVLRRDWNYHDTIA